VKVTDDKGVAVSCPKTTLAAGESMTCTGSGKAVACQYANIGTVTGKTPGGQTLTASDPSHYYGKTYPAIDVETKVNGDDADSPKGPEVTPGSALSFTYIVKNTGDSTLTGIVVTDSKGVAVSCPKTSLAAIGFWYVCPLHRRSVICPALEPREQSSQVHLQIPLILLCRDPVDSGCPVVTFRHLVGFTKCLHLADVDV